MTDDRRTVIRPMGKPGDLGWVVLAHGTLYADEFGWDTDFEALVAGIVADYAASHDPATEAAWIAEVDGSRAGCVLCVAGDEPGTAKLRILLVDPVDGVTAWGPVWSRPAWTSPSGPATDRITLWTNDVLTSARRIYQAAGFELVSEEPHRSFGHDLVGQQWSRRW